MTSLDTDLAAPTADRMSETDARALVTQLYQVLLRRNPDAVGMEHYVHALTTEGVAATVPVVLGNFVGSDEFNANVPKFFGRNRDHINAQVRQATGMVVQTGPFAGMTLIERSNRGDGDVSPKLLGTYEQGLHPAFARFAGRTYDSVIDVGCAEGYYTVGLARMFPDLTVRAYDTDAEALSILTEAAAVNGCGDRIEQGGFCDGDTLIALLEAQPRSLLIIDCETYEKVLFGDPHVGHAARHADMIIECHDLWDPEITPLLTRTLAPTHAVSIVGPGARDPHGFDFMADWSEWDRWMAVWERRISVQNWLICEGRGEAA